MAAVPAATTRKAGPELGAGPRMAEIRRQIARYFLLISLAPTLIAGVVSYMSARAAINRKTADHALAEVIRIVANTQTKLAEFENISMRLFVNKDFNSTLSAYARGIDKPERSANRKIIEDCFNEYMISNQDIFAFMFICGPDAGRSILIAKDYQQDFLRLMRDFSTCHAYQDIIRAGGGLVWSRPVGFARSHFVMLGRYIKDMSSGQPLGILAIAVDEDRIDQLVNLTVYNRLQVSLGEIESYSIIIDNDGEVVSTPYKEDIGKDISLFMQDVGPLQKLFKPISDRDYGSEVNQGSFITRVNGKQTLVTYKTISSKIGVGGKSGWHLVSLAPTSYFYKELMTLGFCILALVVVFGILAIMAARRVSSAIARMM